MIISKTCTWGIRAIVFLAQLDRNEYVTTEVVASRLGLSPHTLAKVLQQLTDTQILTTQRGPKGGVSLGRPMSEISLYDMVCAIDGDGIFKECFLGLPGCGTAEPCPAHDMWSDVRNELTSMSKQATLIELRNDSRFIVASLANT